MNEDIITCLLYGSDRKATVTVDLPYCTTGINSADSADKSCPIYRLVSSAPWVLPPLFCRTLSVEELCCQPCSFKESRPPGSLSFFFPLAFRDYRVIFSDIAEVLNRLSCELCKSGAASLGLLAGLLPAHDLSRWDLSATGPCHSCTALSEAHTGHSWCMQNRATTCTHSTEPQSRRGTLLQRNTG